MNSRKTRFNNSKFIWYKVAVRIRLCIKNKSKEKLLKSDHER